MTHTVKQAPRCAPPPPDPAGHPRQPAETHCADCGSPTEHRGASTPHCGSGQGSCGTTGHTPAAAGPGRPLRQAGAAADPVTRTHGWIPGNARQWRPQGLNLFLRLSHAPTRGLSVGGPLPPSSLGPARHWRAICHVRAGRFTAFAFCPCSHLPLGPHPHHGQQHPWGSLNPPGFEK